MKIDFRLDWVARGPVGAKSFKAAACYSLAAEYMDRIKRFAQVSGSGSLPEGFKKAPGAKLWLCDFSPGSQMLSSEALARTLEKTRDSGTRELLVVIGGPNGFAFKKSAGYPIDMRWSFGPLTLPHELALVVACEQIYRAFTILSGLPYHLGHE